MTINANLLIRLTIAHRLSISKLKWEVLSVNDNRKNARETKTKGEINQWLNQEFKPFLGK